jgi:hypothetical protein
MNKDVSDMALFESYFIEDDKRNIPDSFADQNLQPGSWIVSYKVNNDDTWGKIKNGEFYGFSIEGWFKEIEVAIKQKQQVKSKNKKMKKKSLSERLGFKKPVGEALKFDKDKHGEATTVDGVVVMWEGDAPVEGESLFIADAENEGEMILADSGDYSFEIDGTLMVATVDDAGLISALVAADVEEVEDEELSEAMLAMKADYEKQVGTLKTALATQKTDFTAQLKVVGESFDTLSTTVDGLVDPKKKKKHSTQPQKPSWKRK